MMTVLSFLSELAIKYGKHHSEDHIFSVFFFFFIVVVLSFSMCQELIIHFLSQDYMPVCYFSILMCCRWASNIHVALWVELSILFPVKLKQPCALAGMLSLFYGLLWRQALKYLLWPFWRFKQKKRYLRAHWFLSPQRLWESSFPHILQH